MASESVMNKPTTTTVEFGFIPVADKNLFETQDGMPFDIAVETASCLEDSVQRLLSEAVGHDGMSPEAAYLCRFALDAAKALRTAAGQEGWSS